MFCAEPPGQRANHLVVGAAIRRRLDRLRRELQILVRARGIEVVVLQEHRRRQNDVGVARGVGHELLVHDDKQILAAKSAAHFCLIGRDHHRVGVLDQHRLDRAAALQRFRVAREDGAETALVEPPHPLVARVKTFDQGLVELVDGAAGLQRAAALMRPGAGDDGDARAACMFAAPLRWREKP